MTKPTQLSGSQRKPPAGKPFPKGKSGNPGGVSKEKRAFLARMTSDDGETIYEGFMALIREGNVPATLLGVQYLAGKPANAKEDNEALKSSLTVVVQSLAERVKP